MHLLVPSGTKMAIVLASAVGPGPIFEPRSRRALDSGQPLSGDFIFLRSELIRLTAVRSRISPRWL